MIKKLKQIRQDNKNGINTKTSLCRVLEEERRLELAEQEAVFETEHGDWGDR